MGGFLDVIVGAGATIGKIFSAVSSIVSQENTLTHSYVDKVTGENKVLNSTGLSIAGGDFIVEKIKILVKKSMKYSIHHQIIVCL